MTDTTWAAKVLAGVPTTSIRRPGSDEDSIEVIALPDALAAIAKLGAGDGLVERLRAMDGDSMSIKTLDEAAAHIAALTAQVAEEQAHSERQASGHREDLNEIADVSVKRLRRAEAAEAERDALRERVARLEREQAYVRTGVKDRDGREICVGDHICIDLSSPHTKKEYWKPIYEVVFKAPQFTIRHIGGDKDSDTAHFYWRVPQRTSTEKIATIYVAVFNDGDKHA